MARESSHYPYTTYRYLYKNKYRDGEIVSLILKKCPVTFRCVFGRCYRINSVQPVRYNICTLFLSSDSMHDRTNCAASSSLCHTIVHLSLDGSAKNNKYTQSTLSWSHFVKFIYSMTSVAIKDSIWNVIQWSSIITNLPSLFALLTKMYLPLGY
jgi:hypothetical protein